MKITFSLILLVALATPLIAQERADSEEVINSALAALQYGPYVAFPGDGVDDRAVFVVSDATITGGERSLREFVDSLYGREIADEIFASYQSNGREVQHLGTKDVACFHVHPLDDFTSGPRAYSWPALHEKFPRVQFVVRVSRPAFDRLGTTAVVRYERICEQEPFSRSAAFFEFVKGPDGSWRQTRGVIGSLWE